MPAPWEKYQAPAQGAGPWAKYAAPSRDESFDSLPPLPGTPEHDAFRQEAERQKQNRPSLVDRAFRYGGEYLSGLRDANASPDAVAARRELLSNPGSGLRGGAEALLSLASGAVSPITGTARALTFGEDIDKAVKESIWQPRSAAGRATMQALGATVKPLTDVAEATGADVALAPLAAQTQAFPRVPRVATRRPRTADEVLARLQPADSVGAAAASPEIAAASSELRQAIVSTAKKTGGQVNREVLARHADADTLPVPVRLTEGQATGQPVAISREMNMRGRYPQITEHLNQQNKALADNMRVLRDEVGPDVYSANVAEHGDELIGAYKAKDRLAQDDITKKYEALRAAAGGEFPVGGKTLFANISQSLHKKLLYEHAPGPIMAQLQSFTQRQMNYEQFEAMRTNLARIQRSPNVDGNVKAAAGTIREEMEKLPLVPRAAKLKPLADEARKAARARFEALEADPAYKAAVDDQVPPDRFAERFIIRGTRDDLGRMRAAFAGNDKAQQTMGVAVLDYLRDSARLSPHYDGNFAAASYNKALRNLDPKVRHLLPASTIEQLEKLGRVSGYTTAQPRGSFVNNSNTFVSQVADYGAGALEGAANVAAQGVPVGTWTRRAVQSMRSRREMRNALAPGAGLDMPDVNALGGGGR